MANRTPQGRTTPRRYYARKNRPQIIAGRQQLHRTSRADQLRESYSHDKILIKKDAETNRNFDIQILALFEKVPISFWGRNFGFGKIPLKTRHFPGFQKFFNFSQCFQNRLG